MPPGVYVTGETGGRTKGQTDRSERDAFARLLSATDGSTVWTSQFGTRDIDVSFGAALSGDVLYAIGSTAGGFGYQPGIGKGDGFVRAIDATTGAKVWTHQFGTERNDSAYAGWVDGSAIYVVGWTRGASPGFERLGSADAFVTRIDLPPPG